MKKTLLLLLASVTFPALAQDPQDYTLLGGGIRSRPDFDGSDSRKVDVIPVIRYYGKPLFARTTQGILEGGARTPLGTGFVGGVQLAYEQGPLDRDDGLSAGFHLEWDGKLGAAPLNGLARVRHYLDSDRGNQFDLRGTVGVYQGAGATAGVFTQFTFASAENTNAYYGVRDSGLLYTSIGALGSYDIRKEWVAVGSVELRRLAGDIGRNVPKRTGAYVSAGVAYKF